MDAFDSIISTEFLTDAEPDSEATVYGVRIMFYHPTDPDRRITVLAPWLGYSLERAESMRHAVTTNHHAMMTALAMAQHLAPQTEDVAWVPMGVRVVTLAEIPF